MAKKVTRKEQYTEILSDKGFKWEDVSILSFEFQTDKQVEILHFELIIVLGWKVVIYDGHGRVATVIVQKGFNAEQILRDYVAKKGGEEIRPYLG